MKQLADRYAEPIEDDGQVGYYTGVSDSGGWMGGTFILPLSATNDAHHVMRVGALNPTTPIAEPASSSDAHLMFCPTLLA